MKNSCAVLGRWKSVSSSHTEIGREARRPRDTLDFLRLSVAVLALPPHSHGVNVFLHYHIHSICSPSLRPDMKVDESDSPIELLIPAM